MHVLPITTAMGALRALFRQPPPDADETAEFGTMRAEAGVAEFFHANEATKYFRQTFHARFLHCQSV